MNEAAFRTPIVYRTNRWRLRIRFVKLLPAGGLARPVHAGGVNLLRSAAFFCVTSRAEELFRVGR